MSKVKTTMVVQRAIKYAIDPTDEQKVFFAKTFGCCRFIWNQMLGDEQAFYAATDKHFVPTPAKYKNQFPFLKEVDSLALCNEQIALNKAFTGFFEKRSGHPNFKSKKKTKLSYTTNNQFHNGKPTIQLVHNGIRLPKVGVVKANLHRLPKAGWRLKSVTVSQAKSGKYFCSVLFEYEEAVPAPVLPTEDTTLGLDYSSPLFYVDDSRHSPDIVHWFRAEEQKLGKLQRQLSRMQYGSKNYERQKQKFQVLHEHIANRRKDFAHKESRRIANAYDAVCVEDIDLRAISRSLHLGKSTLDNGFGMFRTFLEYKLNEQGKQLIWIDKWFPSTKTCHDCGFVNKDVVLGVSEWVCPECGVLHPRDENAALNIKKEGLRIRYAKAG